MKYFESCTIWLLCVVVVLVRGRGPHHPRGEQVVKRHVHYRPTKDVKLTEDVQLLHDKEHIQEHLEHVLSEEDLAKMSDEELEFYYFQVHDSDKNSKLDGLEIMQAILHTQHDPGDFDDHEEDGDGMDPQAEIGISSANNSEQEFNYLIDLVDRVLMEDDLDYDGYLNYLEYVASRKKDKKSIARMSNAQSKMVL